MTNNEAARILDPETSFDAMVEIEYKNGFSWPEIMPKIIKEARKMGADALRESAQQDQPIDHNTSNMGPDASGKNRLKFWDCGICRIPEWRTYLWKQGFKYCPHCGGPFTLGALAELEKRIGGMKP